MSSSRCRSAERSGWLKKSFRRLEAYWLLKDVYERKVFVDGVALQTTKIAKRKAA
jgi:hypothetical protein